MIYPLVRELGATSATVGAPAAVACRLLKIAKQPFYRLLNSPVSDRDWDDAQLMNSVTDIHRDGPVFEYRFITEELGDVDFEASERRMWRLRS